MKKLFPLLFVIGAVAVLLGLSGWQLQRLQWKEAMIAQYKQAQKLKPVPIAKLEPIEPQDEYRFVRVKGHWLPWKELDLGGRRYYGQTGYNVLTPLKTAEGKVYLINRGWVPMNLKDPKTRKEILPSEEVTVTGMIRLPQKPGPFTPANHPEKNFWFGLDIPAMEKAAGLKLEPLSLEIVDPKAPREIFPVPANGEVVLRNDHLGYAITWFLLAVAAGVIGWLRLKKA